MRSSGILMHLSSLPSPYGIGTMGQAAREFVDFLARAGQSYWQILPINPTGLGDSPYQAFSGFAGNPYFIDLDQLAEEGLLLPEEYRDLDWGDAPDTVNYAALYKNRYTILQRAALRLLEQPPEDYDEFCRKEHSWLEDYAVFMALKEANGGAPWYQWPDLLCHREYKTIHAFIRSHQRAVELWKAIQYLFFHQWAQLKQYANGKGISIIGDIPIYVSRDSVEVWTQPEQFRLDERLIPVAVAGCPPDDFSEDGQLWGNPLFDWDYMEKDGFSWWCRRVEQQREIYDVIRIDHFRGVESFFAIPFGDTTARNGRWEKGPGMKLISAIRNRVGQEGFIAEDLGYLTPEVVQMVEDSGYPGMKVLEFAFDSREGGDYLPHNYSKHCVVYTGTHDNSTVMGWMENAPRSDVERAKAYLGLSEQEGYHWGMMRGVWSSVGELAIVQMQDLLGLDDRSRMNTPSTVGANWRWRMLPGAADQALAEKLHAKMELYDRCNCNARCNGN